MGDMGTTYLSHEDVLGLTRKLRKHWPGSVYDLMKRNCCHFSDDLCVSLGCGTIPTRIKNLAATGAALVDLGVDAKEFMNSYTQQLGSCAPSTCCCCCTEESQKLTSL